ncbi:uncharacterized protein E0L32_008823 [Thyridium curvatum]|uniref:Hydroxyproline-rich glyco protein n=1 Tax=Thyridium curvatum TaxID=1093900 RepID=A0A507ATE8_9PEZI|nr:uncharacterized protein E0L32_008823 [Thyridium curvatum]TPX09976.1 hypothetical protein E0L32_008823 [Thyridium curvatum]
MDGSLPDDEPLPEVIVIASDGDAILDVVFESSRETLTAARKAAQVRPTLRARDGAAKAVPKARTRVAYRVKVDALRKHSKYFDNLLGDTRFQEAKTIVDAFKNMSLRGVEPAELEDRELPRIPLGDDDEATRSVGRDVVFAELLRILHRKETVKTMKNPPTLLQLSMLAVLADRFDCKAPVSAYMRGLRFKFPQPRTRVLQDEGGPPVLANEDSIRQKILTSWLLNEPARFQTGTKELILFGSRNWSLYREDEESQTALWWDLPDGLERELQYRRECILNCIASIQSHFLGLYTSRTRQCKLGYSSSVACDSFQLGEMVRFLSNKELMFLVDFSPASVDQVSDCSTTDIYHILSTLKQCPSYQIDNNHTNCGLRTRILPILEYIHSMLSSSIVAISRNAWEKDREGTSWAPRGDGDDGHAKVFKFTRSLSGDQRLRFEGAMAADRMARELFTSTEWDWTPET